MKKLKPIYLLTSLCLVVLLMMSANGYSAKAPAQATAAATLAANTGATINIKMGYSTWVGYGPLFIARDKGYFADQGINVELIKVEDPKDRFTALAGSQLDSLVSTLDTMSQYWKTETPFHAILGLDESSGGDGIVTKPEITSVKDLKGKQIGVNVGSVSQFFLEFVLQQNGMTDSDVTLVKMKQGDLPTAFAAGHIDTRVTWNA